MRQNLSPDELAARLAPHRERLIAQPKTSVVSRLMRVASVITDAFVEVGASPPVVVGGLAVETYTAGGYTTKDIDMIAEDPRLETAVMTALGFRKKPGVRHYEHPSLDVMVEFPTGPLEGSSERIADVQLEGGGRVYVIGVEDIILDRLAAYEHWDHRRANSEDATQAVSLIVAHRARIDWDYLQQTADLRGLSDALRELIVRSDKY
ncbi:MAG: hypothetical protein Q7T82_20485 [Armatimonadota bacterium]|nr:hypothetical protein [Armatimonadota bacterium]